MLKKRIISWTRELFLGDPELQELFGGDDYVYYIVGDDNIQFPHIAHNVKIKSINDPVFFGNYCVDILAQSLNADIIETAADRITYLLDKRIDRGTGGGLRFFIRDRDTISIDKWFSRGMLLFYFRGVDTELMKLQTT